MGFSDNLRMLLKDRCLKQADLCRMTGIQTSLMSDYLGGKKSPTIGNAILIADALNITLDLLVCKDADSSLEEQKSSRLLSDIYNSAKELSEEDQDYILDMIKTFQRHRETITDGKES